MSLDFCLEGEEQEVECVCATCDNKHTRRSREVFYDSNITHNLTRMADKAGIYEALWHPEEIKVKYGKDIISLLERGLADLNKRPTYFKQFNASNGWGLYEQFVPFVEEVLEACRRYPDAEIIVSR